MLPALFLAHGSPMMAIEYNEYTRFLNKLGNSLNPKAIVIFSAHWDSKSLTISASDKTYETIYDFYGFPEQLYNVEYAAKGSSVIAANVEDKLKGQGFAVKKDLDRGLDHGSWTLLMHLFPKADIPVVQVSINSELPISDQIKIGSAIKALGEENILVICSGNTVHNLGLVNWSQTTTDPWAYEFDDWLINKLNSSDIDALNSYKKLAPNVNLAVPTPEHFVPLFIALGAGRGVTPKILYRNYELGNLSYLCLQF